MKKRISILLVSAMVVCMAGIDKLAGTDELRLHPRRWSSKAFGNRRNGRADALCYIRGQ